MSSNITEVRLLSVPLEKDYIHTIYFSDAAAQSSYFIGKTQKHYTGLSYQRKDNFIRIPAQFDTLLTCNYVIYKNAAFSNKWFYAFITDLKYIDDGRTDVYIETDVIQTWLFDYNLKSSFVEREHVKNDAIGLHTVPEGLELGEFICNGVSTDTKLKDYSYVIQVTEDTNGGALYATNFGGVWSAGGAYVCKTGAELVSIINLYSNAGKADAVFGVYLIPDEIINLTGEDMQYDGSATPTKYIHSITKPDTIDGYEPANNKLLTYPYHYLMLSNNSGSSNILQYEHFSSENDINKCEFEIEGVPTVGGSIKCVPVNYKGAERNQDEGIILGKFPVCSWSQDMYINWLTQNAVNIGLGVASGGLQALGGLALMGTGGGALAGAGSVASGFMSVAATVGQVYQMSFMPNSAKGNTNGGDINASNKMNTFYFYKMSIKSEYAKIVDGYFNMYGYKVNSVKVPEKNHRENYWFTKTIDANIDGNIPPADLQKIKDCYNRGITFWKNPANIGNYNIANLPT